MNKKKFERRLVIAAAIQLLIAMVYLFYGHGWLSVMFYFAAMTCLTVAYSLTVEAIRKRKYEPPQNASEYASRFEIGDVVKDVIGNNVLIVGKKPVLAAYLVLPCGYLGYEAAIRLAEKSERGACS